MGKTLTIISYSDTTINMYHEQIKSLFADNINVIKHRIGDVGIEDGITGDLVLVPCYDAFARVRDCIGSQCKVIFASRTISKSGFDKIMDIPEGSKVMLFDESPEMSKQMISVVHQLGARHIDLIPAYPGIIEGMRDKTVIILGESSHMGDSCSESVNIGSSLLDIDTIIDIAVILNLDHIINKQNIRESYKETVTPNFGLSEILGRTNRFESQFDILFQVIDDGVIGVDPKGIVLSYNENAEVITGYKKERVIGKNGIDILPMIPFTNVFKNLKSVKEKLIKINNDDVVVSVDPIIHSGNFYGAIGIIKKFNDAEKKQHRLRAQLIGKGHKAKYNFDDIIGRSDAVNKCKEIAKRMAKSNSSILITGESGTGKELFAQAIHRNSKRKDYQFVAVNCGALPETLLESELFGYEEGAFTGARKGGKPGLFELAHRGTLFLDEIGEMPPNLQMRLLRVLQEREVMRIGGDRLIDVDIRIIAATNKNIKEMVKNGEFREDLYYRINVLPLKIPPLRDRTEDILLLMDEFKMEFNGGFEITEGAKEVLLCHNWRGNVRELRNYVEYFANLDLKEIDIGDLPFDYDDSLDRKMPMQNEGISIEDFLETTGKNIKKYVFVLNELKESYCKGKRLGRRSICKIASGRGIFISEQEIRKILADLEKCLMVEIQKGRSGTVITEYGTKVLDYLKMG